MRPKPKAKPEADSPTPPLPGTVEIRGEWGKLSKAVQDKIFDTLRPTLPPGRGRVIISPGLVRVEEAPMGYVPLVKDVMALIGKELGRREKKPRASQAVA